MRRCKVRGKMALVEFISGHSRNWAGAIPIYPFEFTYRKSRLGRKTAEIWCSGGVKIEIHLEGR